MPNVAWVLRDGYDARFLLAWLQQADLPYHVTPVLETGALARRKKLRRVVKSYAWYQYPAMVLDLGALWLYDKVLTGRMQKQLGRFAPPVPAPYTIDDINEPRAIEHLRALAPDVILVYGVGILTRATLDALPCEVYNIHSSVLPYYKNVHSDFWAYCHGDLDKIGITIFKLDTGIDTGNIALQRAVQQVCPGAPLTLAGYKCENLRLICRLLPEFLARYFAGTVQLRRQPEVQSTGKTPRFRDLWRYLTMPKP